MFTHTVLIEARVGASLFDCHCSTTASAAVPLEISSPNHPIIDRSLIRKGNITLSNKPLSLFISPPCKWKPSPSWSPIHTHLIVLGLPWLQQNNPIISCTNRDHSLVRLLSSEFHKMSLCNPHQRFHREPRSCNTGTFSECGLPPHHKYNCSIDLLPGTSPCRHV